MQALVSKLETKVYAPDTPRIYAQRLAHKLEQLQEQIDYERDRELALRPYLVALIHFSPDRCGYYAVTSSFYESLCQCSRCDARWRYAQDRCGKYRD
jgi:hypothetical protein